MSGASKLSKPVLCAANLTDAKRCLAEARRDLVKTRSDLAEQPEDRLLERRGGCVGVEEERPMNTAKKTAETVVTYVIEGGFDALGRREMNTYDVTLPTGDVRRVLAWNRAGAEKAAKVAS